MKLERNASEMEGGGGYRKRPRPQGENDGEEAGSESIVGTAHTRV